MDIRTYSTTVVSILASKETKELRADLDNARTAASTWKRAAKMLWRCERDAVQMYEREKVERERVEGELMRRIQQLIDANKLNERLTHDLADAQTVAILQRELHAAELGQCASENNQLTENTAELGKALDMALAERNEAFAELDAERNAHNATAAQLYADLAGARAELDAMRQAHSDVAAKMAAMGC